MPVKVNETPFDQPDVSKVTPVYVPKNGTRSYTLSVTTINDRGHYQTVPGYWNDIEKRWEYASSGLPIEHEVVKTESINNKPHYE